MVKCFPSIHKAIGSLALNKKRKKKTDAQSTTVQGIEAKSLKCWVGVRELLLVTLYLQS